MPLTAQYSAECSGCGAVETQTRELLTGEHPPRFVLPPDWTQDKQGVWCPPCTAERILS